MQQNSWTVANKTTYKGEMFEQSWVVLRQKLDKSLHCYSTAKFHHSRYHFSSLFTSNWDFLWENYFKEMKIKHGWKIQSQRKIYVEENKINKKKKGENK